MFCSEKTKMINNNMPYTKSEPVFSIIQEPISISRLVVWRLRGLAVDGRTAFAARLTRRARSGASIRSFGRSVDLGILLRRRCIAKYNFFTCSVS
jgi:hypothetical protein